MVAYTFLRHSTRAGSNSAAAPVVASVVLTFTHHHVHVHTNSFILHLMFAMCNANGAKSSQVNCSEQLVLSGHDRNEFFTGKDCSLIWESLSGLNMHARHFGFLLNVKLEELYPRP